ncbi:MAG: hypothetical protein U0736_08035 [Gemmataceae bacterium]
MAASPLSSTTRTAATCRAACPAGARAPEALVASIPPTVHTGLSGSGANRRPCAASVRFSSARVTPASTSMVSPLSGPTARKCGDRSTTTPSPSASPASPVPAPRAISGTPMSPA